MLKWFWSSEGVRLSGYCGGDGGHAGGGRALSEVWDLANGKWLWGSGGGSGWRHVAMAAHWARFVVWRVGKVKAGELGWAVWD